MRLWKEYLSNVLHGSALKCCGNSVFAGCSGCSGICFPREGRAEAVPAALATAGTAPGWAEWKMREKVWEKVTEPNLALHLPPGEGPGMFLSEAKIP